MKLTEEQLNKIIVILGKYSQTSKIKIGSLIYSSTASDGLITIVTKGSIRVIDNFQTFKSQSLVIDQSPYLFGNGL